MKHAPPTPSQLDIIAEVNARAARQGSGRRILWFAVVCGAILAGAAAWRWLPPTPPPVLQAAPAAAPTAPADTAPTVPAGDRAVEAAASVPSAEASPPPAAATLAEADNRARKPRARREAELPASAAPVQQQGLQPEAVPPQPPPPAGDVALAASRGAAESAPEPRRSVDELCQASGNFVSRLLCQSRECRRADNASDAHCVRLREIEEARRRREPP